MAISLPTVYQLTRRSARLTLTVQSGCPWRWQQVRLFSLTVRLESLTYWMPCEGEPLA